MTFDWFKAQWDRVLAVIATVLGLVAITLGWIGVSGRVLPSEQLPYLASGAAFGIFALGIAATLWLSADLRDQWQKMAEIDQRLEAMENDPTPTGVSDAPVGTRANGSRRRLAAS